MDTGFFRRSLAMGLCCPRRGRICGCCKLSSYGTDGNFLRRGRDDNVGDVVSKLGQREWKDYQWEEGNACLSSSDMQWNGATARRPGDDLVAYPSPLLPHVDKSQDRVYFKDQQDKMDAEGLATGHISDLNFARFAEKDTESRIEWPGSFFSDNCIGDSQCFAHDHSFSSIARKPLKWARSSSFSSRSSVLSQATSLRSVKAELDDGPGLPRKATPVQSPKGDIAVGVTSAVPFEEMYPRKKQRLGWGQGLAKYEKQKVEGQEETYSKSELVQFASTKAVHIHVPSLPEGSPKLACISGCTSPATLSSVAYSSSPGLEEKPYIKVKDANNVSDISHFSDSLGHLGCAAEFSASVEHFELNPLNCIDSLLVDLLQPEDPCFGDSNLGRSASLNKLLTLKCDILQALEKTECKIDSFENELKALNSEAEMNGPHPLASEPFGEADDASKVTQESKSLGDFVYVRSLALVEPTVPVGHELLEVFDEVKDKEINGSECVTSKHSKPDMLKSGEGAADVEVKTIGGLQGTYLSFTMDIKRLESAAKDDLENCFILNKCKTGDAGCFGISVPHEADDALTALILNSNKKSARRASEAFDKYLPPDLPKFDFGGTDNVSYRGNKTHIVKKLAARKSFVRFKERILTLKYMVFHHLWKEDMRLLSIRKHQAKPHKHFEQSTRPSQSGFRKYRSSIRSRFTSPAGNLTLVPTTEMVDFSGKLLSDSHMKLYRSTLKMPALVLDEMERMHLKFITSNGLVEDPCAVEKERTMINPWSSEEKEIFMEMLATFGKDFSKIASFLIHKTTADCIEFYYKNHKSESFVKIKKRLDLRKLGSCLLVSTYLVTSGKKWHQREPNAASLDMLGSASIVTSHAGNSVKTHRTYGGRSILGVPFDSKLLRAVDGVIERVSDAERSEKEAAAADVLAGICGAVSSEALSSCITSSTDPDDWKCQKKRSAARMDRSLTSEITNNFDKDDTCSDESCGEVGSPIDWTDEEKSVFIGALRAYGKDFASISVCVGTRSQNQCKIFFSKTRKCLGLDGTLGNQGTPTSGTNGGSDTEDACIMEMGSAVCSTRSCSKMDLEQHSVINRSHRDYGQSGNDIASTDMDESSGMDDKMVQSDQVGNPLGDDNRLDLVNMELDFNSSDKVVNKEETQRDITPEVVGDAVLTRNQPAWLSEDVGPSVDMELSVDMQTKEQVTDRPVTPSESVYIEEVFNYHNRSDFSVEVKQEIGAGSLDESLTAEQDKIKIPVRSLPETGSAGREAAKISCLDVKQSATHFPYSNSSSDGSLSAGFNFASNHLSQAPRELPLQNSHFISRQLQENRSSLPEKPLVLPDPYVAPFYDGHLNIQDLRNKHLKSVATDFNQQFPTGHQSLNPQFSEQGLHVLRGSPHEMLTKKGDVNRSADLIREKPAVIQKFPKSDQSSFRPGKFFLQEPYQDNRDGCSKPQHTAAELLFLPKTSIRPADPIKSHLQIPEKSSRISESTVQSLNKTGDVKLFGKILTHTSPIEKSTIQEENDGRSANKTSTSKFSCELSGDGVPVIPKLEPSGYLGLDELSKRSFGLWDGNKIQTGFLSLPDPKISKYTAFDDNYRGPSCRVDQQPVEQQDSGLFPVFSMKDVFNRTSAPMDYQAYRSYAPRTVQHFAVDAKQADVFTEMQKWKGFCKGQQITTTGFPCPSQGVVRMGGIFSGEGVVCQFQWP